MGQLHVSPTQATGIPCTVKWVALALITLPPCDVASPSRMTFFMEEPWLVDCERKSKGAYVYLVSGTA